MTSEARYDFDVSLANASENDHSAFCSVSPAVAQCTCSIRNSIFLTSLLVLLFGESECTKNNTMAAALVILLRNVERPKAGLLASWRTFLLCKHRLACQVSQTRHGKLGPPAKSSGPFLGPKNPVKKVPPPQLRLLNCIAAQHRYCRCLQILQQIKLSCWLRKERNCERLWLSQQCLLACIFCQNAFKKV